MAKNIAKEERIKALVAELLADEEAEGFDAQNENINDIEDAMVRIGDLVAREVGVREVGPPHRRSPRASAVSGLRPAGRASGGACPGVDHRAGIVSSGRGEVSLPELSSAFFSLRRTDWGIEARYNYTPRMYRRIVFAAAQGVQLWRGGGVALSELGRTHAASQACLAGRQTDR